MELKDTDISERAVKVIPSAERGIFSRGMGIEHIALSRLVRIQGIAEGEVMEIEATQDLVPLAKYIEEDPSRPGEYKFVNGARASILSDHEAGGFAQVGDGLLVETLPPQTAQFGPKIAGQETPIEFLRS